MEFKARDKVTRRITKNGLVERNEATGEESRVSKRETDIDPRRERHNEHTTPRAAAPTKHGRGTQGPRESPPPARRQPPPQREPDAAPKRKPPGKNESPPPDPGRLKFAADEKPPEPPGKKLKRARASAVRADLKLEQAQNALPTKRVLRADKAFDGQKGKMKRRLRFETRTKSQAEHLRGPAVARPVKTAGNAALMYGHKKLYEVQRENTGVEAGHKAELAAEGGLRMASHRHKTAPYRKVEKYRRRATRAHAKSAYHQALHDDPKLKSNIISRMARKRKIQREYAKAAREAKKAAKRARKAGGIVSDVTKSAAGLIKRHPVAAAVTLLIVLTVVFIIMAFSSASNFAAEGAGTILATSYLAPDTDIDDAELAYTEWETDLQIEINNTERRFPGFDEYRYSVDDIGHGPHKLMAYLTAAYEDFSFAAIRGDLRAIFDAQYQLAYTEEVEIRTRTVTLTDPVTGQSYETEEEYEWRILNVTLTARSFTDVIYPMLDAEQAQRYGLLTRVKGNRQYAGSPFAFNWLFYVSDGYGWRIHPVNGNKDNHMGVDVAVAAGTEILAAHDGTVTFAGDNGSYGLVVFIEGENGVETRYAHCGEILVSQGQTVTMGDVIAKVGSTGVSTGPHLHFEVLKDGQHLNPLYFAITNDDGSSYIPPGTPGGRPIPAYPGAPMASARFAAMMEEAQKHLGKPYVFGASGPDKFDCSGFVSYVLAHSIYPGFGRTTAQGLYNICTPVSRADAQPGDLIFFTGTYNAGRPVTHIGIYIGNGQMIHSGKPVQYASIDTPYWTSHYYAMGRLP
jgi:murein DD-endopeptidase MepM/ murein hydrolase activator NlpD